MLVKTGMLWWIKMPGYIIHLAVGKIYLQHNKVEDIQRFEKGIIAPDRVTDKKKSHYGPYSSKPGLSKYLQENGCSSSYEEGYFLHLATDYLFYNKFLTNWDVTIYEDYDKLNAALIQRYNIKVPEEIEETVQFEEGCPTILKLEELCSFINTVGKINFKKITKKSENVQEQIEQELKEGGRRDEDTR